MIVFCQTKLWIPQAQRVHLSEQENIKSLITLSIGKTEEKKVIWSIRSKPQIHETTDPAFSHLGISLQMSWYPDKMTYVQLFTLAFFLFFIFLFFLFFIFLNFMLFLNFT